MTILTRLDARLLLAHATGWSREWIVAHPEAPISEEQAKTYASYVQRRRAGEPTAYILGSAGFYGREFLVNRNVLVPRPESEHLVDEALSFVQKTMRVLDVGTGCGAIACTIAAETGATVDATDISAAALEVARKNADRLGVADRVRFHYGDLFEPVQDRRYDVIVANLPYLPSNDLPQSPHPASFEPSEALDGGHDGLAAYRRLLPALPALLNSNALILLEAAPPTIRGLAKLVRAAMPRRDVLVGYDYAGLARYVKA